MATNLSLTPLPALEKLSPVVFRVLGGNPGPMTLQGTNAYLLGSGQRKILLDTSEAGVPAWSANLRQALASFTPPASIQAIICTHWHPDHVGGVPDALDVAGDASIPVWKFPRPDGKERPEFIAPAVYSPIRDGQTWETEGVTLKAVYTPGHADDHVCLHLAEEEALFSGDAVLGEGSAVFEDLYDYMRSLKLMLKLPFRRLYPAHGPVVEDGPAKLREYIQHREAREEQCLEALRSVSGSLAPDEVMELLYPGLNPALRPAAHRNVQGHLDKLCREGRIESDDGGSFRLLSTSRI